MMDANCWPSCSKAIRFEAGVFAAKKVVQLAAIFEVAEPPGAVVVGEVAGVVGDVGGDGEVPPDVPLLPQAVTTAASAQAPSIAEACLLVFIQLFSNLFSAGGIPPRAGSSGLQLFFPERVSPGRLVSK